MILNHIQNLSDLPKSLKSRAETVDAQAKDAQRWIRRRIYDARTKGEGDLWDLHLQALDHAEKLLDRASSVKAIAQGVPVARRVLGQIEQFTAHAPIEGYDELNVRDAMEALRSLGHLGLLRIERYERQHKNRKTLLDAIEREQQRRARLAAFGN